MKETLLFFSTNMKLIVRNTAPNWPQCEKWREATPEIGIISGTVVRKAKGYSVVVLKTTSFCAIHTRMVHSSQCHLPRWKHHKTNVYPVGSFAQNLCEVFSVASSRVTCGFLRKIITKDSLRLKTVRLGRGKKLNPNFKTQLTKTQKTKNDPGLTGISEGGM